MAVSGEPKTAGEVLRDHMKARGWTQIELARRSGLTQGYISDLCRNVRPMVAVAAVALERAFGTPTAETWLQLEVDRRLREAREKVAS